MCVVQHTWLALAPSSSRLLASFDSVLVMISMNSGYSTSPAAAALWAEHCRTIAFETHHEFPYRRARRCAACAVLCVAAAQPEGQAGRVVRALQGGYTTALGAPTAGTSTAVAKGTQSNPPLPSSSTSASISAMSALLVSSPSSCRSE